MYTCAAEKTVPGDKVSRPAVFLRTEDGGEGQRTMATIGRKDFMLGYPVCSVFNAYIFVNQYGLYLLICPSTYVYTVVCQSTCQSGCHSVSPLSLRVSQFM